MDLGTEFAADVDRDGNGEVHVFRGEVIVQPRSLTDSRPLRLGEAQATRIDAASATPSGIEVDSSRFLRQLEEPSTSYSRLISELGPNVLSSHGTDRRWALVDRLLFPGGFGRVVLSPKSWHAVVPGLSRIITASARSEFRRLRHDAVHRRNRFGKTLSVVAWVFAESRPRWASIVKRWGGPATDASISGSSVTTATSRSTSPTATARSPVARGGRCPRGRWHHVAFVADGTTLRLTATGPRWRTSITRGSSRARSTCWASGVKLDKTGDRPDPIEPGYWHGRLDEISIFPRALDPDQILRLYPSAAGPDPNDRP